MKKIALILGTRPEGIKLAPVYLELKKRSSEIETLLWLTGQHLEMLDQVVSAFGLRPDENLALMSKGQTIHDVTIEALRRLRPLLTQSRPDLIVVQGDTTTCFVAALAAFYEQIPVAHVEAGLRTNNKYSPFPEEINRRLCTQLTDLHFAPTEKAKANLLKESIDEERVWVTGNTVVDALDHMVGLVREKTPDLPEDFCKEVFTSGKQVILVTGHRRESFGEGMESFCEALKSLAEKYPTCEFVYPVHLNPNVQEPVFRILSQAANVHLTKPLDYPAFVWAMDRCHFLISDSGGVQEEAPHLGKPVLVTRDNTERPEAVEVGTAKLVGTSFDKIVKEASLLLDSEEEYQKMSLAKNPFGDGQARKRIVDACLGFLQSAS